jgi:hypothetical protein
MKERIFKMPDAPVGKPLAEAEADDSGRAADPPVAAPDPQARPAAPRPSRRATDGGLSAAAFRQLFTEAAPDLADAGVSASFGTTVGSRRAPGPTWVSVTSPWGHGRLIRRADGSFECGAHRIPGGEPLCAERGEQIRPEDLDDLIAAVSRPRAHEAPRRDERP